MLNATFVSLVVDRTKFSFFATSFGPKRNTDILSAFGTEAIVSHEASVSKTIAHRAILKKFFPFFITDLHFNIPGSKFVIILELTPTDIFVNLFCQGAT